MKSSNEKISIVDRVATPEPVIITNDRKNIIRHGRQKKPPKLSRKLYLSQSPLQVADKETLKLVQILKLHEAIDYTASTTGSAVLLRSLVQPGTDLGYIRSKQESLHEIGLNDRLRQVLRDFVFTFAKGEESLYKFFNKGLYALFPYHDFKKARKSASDITGKISAIPEAESSYLNGLISNLRAYKGSLIDRMMSGAVYKTFSGLKSRQEVGLFSPKLKFIPYRFTHWIFAGPAVAISPTILGKAGFEEAISPMLTTIGLAWSGIYALYSLFMKPVGDTEKFIEPLRHKCIYDPRFSQMIDSIGMIDELLSFHDFATSLPHATVLPKIADENCHFFQATGLKNPVAVKTEDDFVPNDISMNGARLTFISGPNSGGKTTICKSIVHNQLLAQAASYVLAENATINIADKISYQAPKFDGLQDDEGRFGTELSRTRDIFYSTSPKSLVILDELAEGTTHEEKLHVSFEILSDFHTIGNNTVLVTHNHSLVDRFMEEQKGQCLMVEFKDDKPTYRIIPGISKESHAERIVEKIHFSKEDRHQYMKEKGYLDEV